MAQNNTNDIKTVQEPQQEQDFSKGDEPQLGVGGHGATQRRLRNYQVTMIGFCSGIGTGLFIGTGSAYASAGPAGLLLAYIVVGSVLWCVMQSIGELATLVSFGKESFKKIPRQTKVKITDTSNTEFCSSLLLVRSPIGQLASLTQLSVSLWPSLTDTATPLPSPQNVQLPPCSSATGPTSHPPSSSVLVWC